MFDQSCLFYSNLLNLMKCQDLDLAQDEAPSVMVVDAGDVFVGGRYHSLVPVLREVYDNNRDFYHAVAVIKKGSLTDVYSLSDLRDKHACFAGVGTQVSDISVEVSTFMIFLIRPDGQFPCTTC